VEGSGTVLEVVIILDEFIQYHFTMKNFNFNMVSWKILCDEPFNSILTTTLAIVVPAGV
jgi:hypothetical protein